VRSRALTQIHNSRAAQAGWAAMTVGALVLLALALLAGAGRTRITATLTGGLLYALIVSMMLRGLKGHAPHASFGLANRVTLLRAGIATVLSAIAVEGLAGGYNGLELGVPGRGNLWSWAVVAAALVGLVLDGVDGWLARRLELTSAFGARFDMEVDALSVLALAMLVVVSGRAGGWVLFIGLMRYIFIGLGWLWPALTAPLSPSFRRQAICVLTTAALLISLLPGVQAPAPGILLGSGMAALVWSFSADILTLLTRGRGRRAAVSTIN
jgi:phosphatidylglycerophosphate synthase